MSHETPHNLTEDFSRPVMDRLRRLKALLASDAAELRGCDEEGSQAVSAALDQTEKLLSLLQQESESKEGTA